MTSEEKQKAQHAANLPPLSQLTDRFGNTFFFGNAGDYWHPPFPIGANTDFRTHARKVRNMEIRPDDILMCSYPKTGSHWTQEIILMLMQGKAEYSNDAKNRETFLDFRPFEVFASIPSPRLLVTHVPFRHLPKEIFEKKIKVVLLDRNPKDVLVSAYNFWHARIPPRGYPGTFEQFFYLYFEVGYMYGDFFDYMMEWQNGIEAHSEMDFYVSVFEDMKLDPVGGVKKLNKYLGTGCSEELCEEIAIACTFQNLKAFKDSNTPESFKVTLRSADLSLYRKGEVGDWKNWFTVAMNEYFDKEYKNRMSGYKINYKFT